MTVAIIDYGSGNLHSAAKMFERATAELDPEISVTSDVATVAEASHIVLPGVGAFADCKAGLDALPGMHDVLERTVREGGRPFLGICVGMQLMAARGLERGAHDGFGWIAGDVVAIEPADPELKIPHMGWNELEFDKDAHPLLDGLRPGSHFYFVHSYQLACADADTRLASVDYGGPITAMVGRDNMVGTQFHPEKSQANGLRLISNFLKWRP